MNYIVFFIDFIQFLHHEVQNELMSKMLFGFTLSQQSADCGHFFNFPLSLIPLDT